MSSAAKALANRANASHSTGPADTSRTRFNGLSHGLTSKQTVIPGEDQREYEGFAAALINDLKPGSPVEQLLADRIVAAAWRLKRFTRVESAFFTVRIEAYLKENPTSDPDTAMANLFVDPVETARMRLFLRYQTSVQKEYDTAMKEFRKIQAEHKSNSLERAYSDLVDTWADATPSPVNTNGGFASQSSSQRAPQDVKPVSGAAAGTAHPVKKAA